ncbi:hypothetical protein FRC06_000611 [Ceratobasidium sp. 370]|nr:hypothetical protein FRC06_000611 [Ceratobasidium sp. 370]
MFRFSFVTVVLALFMALASLAAPVPAAEPAAIQTPDRSVADISLEGRDLEKRRTGKASQALSSKINTKNKFCGKTITVKNTKNGKTTTAKVVDTCPSCGSGDLDLSPAAFKKLGSLSTGVLSVSWDFK